MGKIKIMSIKQKNNLLISDNRWLSNQSSVFQLFASCLFKKCFQTQQESAIAKSWNWCLGHPLKIRQWLANVFLLKKCTLWTVARRVTEFYVCSRLIKSNTKRPTKVTYKSALSHSHSEHAKNDPNKYLQVHIRGHQWDLLDITVGSATAQIAISLQNVQNQL